MDNNILVSEIGERINAYRASVGLTSLLLDPTISKICQIHTDNMATGRIPLGHQGFSSRADLLLKRLSGTKAAENVAFGPNAAEHIVSGWLSSEAHKRNIESDCNLMGIACSSNTVGGVYVSQIFIKADALPVVSIVPPSVCYDGKGNQVPFLASESLLKLVNNHRSCKDLHPLKRNGQLDEIAKNYIIDYSGERQIFDHSGFEQRAVEALNKCGGTAYVENIAKGPADSQKVFDSWLKSTQHADHIEGDFDQTGIAIGGSEESGYIYVQLFVES